MVIESQMLSNNFTGLKVRMDNLWSCPLHLGIDAVTWIRPKSRGRKDKKKKQLKSTGADNSDHGAHTVLLHVHHLQEGCWNGVAMACM